MTPPPVAATTVVCLPTYIEAANLVPVIDAVKAALSGERILVVDDCRQVPRLRLRKRRDCRIACGSR